MGCCCGKKKEPESDTDNTAGTQSKKSSSSGKKTPKCMGGDESTTNEDKTLTDMEQYQFNSSRDDWKLTKVKDSIQPKTIQKLSSTVEFEAPRTTPPANQISNVILFDTKTGSEVLKKVQQNPNILKKVSSAAKAQAAAAKKGGSGGMTSSTGRQTPMKSSERSPKGVKGLTPGGISGSGSQDTSQGTKKDDLDEDDESMKTDFYKTQVNGVEKIAVVFSTEKEMNPEDMQHILSGFMDSVQDVAPQIFKNTTNDKPAVGFAYDSGRPVKVLPKIPRREIVRRPHKKINYEERFNELYARYFEPGPGHITVPKSPSSDDFPGFSQVRPGWLNANGIYYFVILIERDEGDKYIKRLRSNPATALLACEAQGEFFQCEYSGLDMIGLRLFHAKNDIQKVDKAQRILLQDNMKDVKNVAIHTDFDFKTDPYDIANCCDRLELKEEEKREYLLVSLY